MISGTQESSDLSADQSITSSINQSNDTKGRPLIATGIPEKYVAVMVIVMFLFVLGLIIYSVINIHYLKSDPCQVCVDQTGGFCQRENFIFTNIITDESKGGLEDDGQVSIETDTQALYFKYE